MFVRASYKAAFIRSNTQFFFIRKFAKQADWIAQAEIDAIAAKNAKG